MLVGFIEHWVPTVDTISRFWKADFDQARRVLDDLLDDIALNNFTFYTKWYTNGVRSGLPFLRNHPDCSNVRTANDWGRKIIEHLHQRGVTVGAMLQLYTFEASAWGRDLSLDEWDVRCVAPTDGPDVIADFTSDQYRDRLTAIIEEHLREFSELDYLFLEFEGVGPAAADAAYGRWVKKNHEPPAGEVTYSEEVRQYCERLGLERDRSWSNEYQGMFRHYLALNVAAVRRALGSHGFAGTVGLVYHAYSYERQFFPRVIPDKTWWLMPWMYWGWENDERLKGIRQDAVREHVRQLKAAGHAVCYIGDATISPWDVKSLHEFWDICVEERLAGYLGMGNPTVELGLRWQNVTDDHIRAVRKLFSTELCPHRRTVG